MRALWNSGSRVAAVLLAAAVLLQVFCPAGLLAVEVQASHPTPHNGCHGSPSEDPFAPVPNQRCCDVTPAVKPSPLVWHIVSTPLMAEPVSIENTLHLASLQPASITATPLSTPPGFLVLRI